MRVVDSHTEGEPTRLIVEGGPPLGDGPLAQRRERFAREFDHYRSFAINEPRGSDAVVGALLCEPQDKTCAAGLIFFNNTGYLGMCGHGTIGAAVTLAHLRRIGLGRHRFETPVGVVTVDLHTPTEATIENVVSYRYRSDVTVNVEGVGAITGDIAWGGNWFFLADGSPYPLEPPYLSALTQAAQSVSDALAGEGITGDGGAPIDHIEFFGPPQTPEGNSRNFVLCPGGAYDRSPCGTGTSAKLAALARAGKLAPGVDWIQESILGSRFVARYRLDESGNVIPSITGRAFVVAEAQLLQHPDDPFREGIRLR